MQQLFILAVGFAAGAVVGSVATIAAGLAVWLLT